jgi:hypothetical protein
MTNLTTTSDWLAEKIASIQDAQGKTKFEILGDNLGGKGLPLVAWKLKNLESYDGMSQRFGCHSTKSQQFLTFMQSSQLHTLCVLVAGSVSEHKCPEIPPHELTRACHQSPHIPWRLTPRS